MLFDLQQTSVGTFGFLQFSKCFNKLLAIYCNNKYKSRLRQTYGNPLFERSELKYFKIFAYLRKQAL